MTTQNSGPKAGSGKIVAVAAFAAFLATFNETFLNVAFTPIMKDFSVSVSSVQWLATAYMLGAAVMVPISAFAYKKFPTKPLFLITVSALIIGSIIGAFAPSFPMLLSGRIIQSLGTGMLIPIGMNVTLQVAPRKKLGTYMGIMGAMTTLGPSLSVILAGVLLSTGNWRLLLWFFAALSLLLFLCGAVLLKNISQLTNPKLDIISVILISLSLIGILYGISSIFTGSVPFAVLAILAGSILIMLFVSRQKKLKEPLIDLRPLSVMPFTIGVIINMISLIVIFAMNILMPMFMQSTLGTSSFKASLTLFPAILLSCAVAPVAGRICDKHGVKLMLPLGFILISACTVLLAFVKDTGNLILMAVIYIPVICGSALIIGPVQSFALSKLDKHLNPHGVTVMSTGFQIAGCIGSSVFTGVYSLIITVKSDASSFYTATSSGFTVASLLAAGFALIGLILSVYLNISGSNKTRLQEPVATGILHKIMKSDVYTIHPDATLIEALSVITDKKISGLPVADSNGTLCGFISDGDIMRALAKAHPIYSSIYSLASMDNSDMDFEKRLNDLKHMKVSDMAVKKIISVDYYDDLEEVCRILYDNHLKKAPVLKDGKPVGIINRSNIIKYTTQRCLEAAQS